VSEGEGMACLGVSRTPCVVWASMVAFPLDSSSIVCSDCMSLLGDVGDASTASGGRVELRILIVTRLGSCSTVDGSLARVSCSGVRGCAVCMAAYGPVLVVPTSVTARGESGLSADLLGELMVSEVRRRFLDDTSASSKGFGRVEHGSEDTARSLESADGEGWSIGIKQHSGQVWERKLRSNLM
jgi:hypothetical protein